MDRIVPWWEWINMLTQMAWSNFFNDHIVNNYKGCRKVYYLTVCIYRTQIMTRVQYGYSLVEGKRKSGEKEREKITKMCVSRGRRVIWAWQIEYLIICCWSWLWALSTAVFQDLTSLILLSGGGSILYLFVSISMGGFPALTRSYSRTSIGWF